MRLRTSHPGGAAVHTDSRSRCGRRPARVRRLVGALLLTMVAATAVQAQTRTPRPTSARLGSCDGVLDYRQELVPAAFQVVSQTPTPGGRVRVELSAEISDVAGLRFGAASVYPDLVGHDDLGVVADSVLAAEFGAVPTHGTVASVATLSLELPAANVAELVARLADGRLATTVHADEEPVVRGGIRFAMWSDALDYAYGAAEYEYGDNRWDVTGQGAPPAPPYIVGDRYQIVLRRGPLAVLYPPLPLYPGGGDQVESLDDLIDEMCGGVNPCTPPETLYLMAGSDPLFFVPEAAHFVRVETLSRGTIPLPPMHTRYELNVQRTDADDIESIYESASFCTGAAGDVDDPVQVTRLERDNPFPDLQPLFDRTRDEQGQPIRFNGIDFGGVTVSGQVQGHVLKPRLQVQVRPGRKMILASLDTELSMTAELRAGVSHSVDASQALYDLCFPLPSLPMGPVNLNLNLELLHDVSIEGGFVAGAVVGFQKRFEAGVTVGYDSAAADPFIRQHRHGDGHPVAFTPPTLATALGAQMTVATDVRATLRMGARYPYCNTGVGAFLNARAYGGLDVTPLQMPVWQLHHGAELTGGLNFELLGFPLLAFETDALLEVGADDRSGAGTAASAARSTAAAATAEIGADQRWARAYDQILDPSGIVATSIIPLPDGGARVLAVQSVSGGHVLRIDRFGEIVSRVQYDSIAFRPVGIVGLPDGGFAALSGRGRIVRHAADDSVTWASAFDAVPASGGPVICTANDLATVEPPGSAPLLVVAGTTVLDGEPDGCVFAVTWDGALQWARTYEASDTQSFRAVESIIGANGSDVRIAVVGSTSEGSTPLAGNDALVAVLDPSSGDVLWRKAFADGARASAFHDLAQAPDGTLFLAGESPGTVRDRGAAIVARIGPEGSDARMAYLIQDEIWEGRLDFEPFDDTQGGNTPQDVFFGIAPAPGGMVVTGATGESGATWAAKVNPKLGVEWFTTIDGPSLEAFDAIAPTPDGYLVSGFSDSLAGVGQEDRGRWLTVVKLPFEGRVAFRSDAGLTSRYVEPGVEALPGSDGTRGLTELFDPVLDSSDAVTSVAALGDPAIAPDSFCTMTIDERGEGTSRRCTDDDDGDGWPAPVDNCSAVANPDQLDANFPADDDPTLPGNQHYGNACDADLDDDGVVGAADYFGVFRPCLGADLASEPGCAVADLDGDGLVAAADFFGHLLPALGTTPGPGASTNSL